MSIEIPCWWAAVRTLTRSGRCRISPPCGSSGRTSGTSLTVRVTNDTLLAIAEAYIPLLRSHRRLERVDLILSFLTAETPSPTRRIEGTAPARQGCCGVGGKDALRAGFRPTERRGSPTARGASWSYSGYSDCRNRTGRSLLRLDPQIEFGPLENRWAAVPMPGTDLISQDALLLIEFVL